MEIQSKGYVQSWSTLKAVDKKFFSGKNNGDYIRSLPSEKQQQKFNELSVHRHLLHTHACTRSSVSFVITVLMKDNAKYPNFDSVLLKYLTYTDVISKELISSIKDYYTQIISEYSEYGLTIQDPLEYKTNLALLSVAFIEKHAKNILGVYEAIRELSPENRAEPLHTLLNCNLLTLNIVKDSKDSFVNADLSLNYVTIKMLLQHKSSQHNLGMVGDVFKLLMLKTSDLDDLPIDIINDILNFHILNFPAIKAHEDHRVFHQLFTTLVEKQIQQGGVFGAHQLSVDLDEPDTLTEFIKELFIQKMDPFNTKHLTEKDYQQYFNLYQENRDLTIIYPSDQVEEQRSSESINDRTGRTIAELEKIKVPPIPFSKNSARGVNQVNQNEVSSHIHDLTSLKKKQQNGENSGTIAKWLKDNQVRKAKLSKKIVTRFHKLSSEDLQIIFGMIKPCLSPKLIDLLKISHVYNL